MGGAMIPYHTKYQSHGSGMNATGLQQVDVEGHVGGGGAT